MRVSTRCDLACGVCRITVWLCLITSLGATETVAQTAPPNVVFIYADDLGFGDIACHGHPHIKTPNIDRLAREGTDFWSFTVVNPVCSPSRTGIVTGQFPSRWGVHQHFASPAQNAARGMPDWLDPQAPLLPRILNDAGYKTAHYGKWHLSGGGISDAPLPKVYGYDDAAVWTGPGRHVFDGFDGDFVSGEASAHDRGAASWISVAATGHAVDFIRRSQGSPFYVNLWLHETHHLVSATDEDKRIYPDTAEPQRTYYAAVSRADRQVGRILDLLDELEIADNTIVIFSSDNGPENSHPNVTDKFYYSVGSTGGLKGRKRSLLLGGVNVPFLVRWPDQVPAGRVDKDTALAGVDVFETLLAATGTPSPSGYRSDGENMLPAWQGKPQSRSKPVFWWWQGGHSGDDWPAYAMRDGDWMLVLDETKQRTELYHVTDDRTQSRNVAPDQPERVAQMQSAIEAWFETLPKSVDPALRTKTNSASPTGTTTGGSTGKSRTMSAQRAAALTRWDINRDGKLDLTEYKRGLKNQDNVESRFKNFDADGDGVLTRQEFVGDEAN